MIRQAQSRAKEARVKVARLLGRGATSRNERSEAKKLSPRRIHSQLATPWAMGQNVEIKFVGPHVQGPQRASLRVSADHSIDLSLLLCRQSRQSPGKKTSALAALTY